MNKEDIITILSYININSDTAGEAVELYIKFMYFEKLVDFVYGPCFVGMIVIFGYFVFKTIKED